MITVSEYVEAVETSLQFWLDAHLNAEKWTEEWTAGDPLYMFKESPVMKNNYFSFDLGRAVYSQMAKNQAYMYKRCKNCGSLNDGFDCCESPRLVRATIAEVEDFLREIEAEPRESDIIETMEKQAFKVYRAALKDIVAPVVTEVKAVLKSIRTAKTQEDKLQAVLWGTRVYHVHGNIMADYADRAQCDVDYKLIDDIRNNGLSSVFSRDEINDFLEA